MLMILQKFSFDLQTFFRFLFSGSGSQLEIYHEKVLLQILKVPTKFCTVPQSFCQNLNPVQDQDQDQDHNFTLDFNNRTPFYA